MGFFKNVFGGLFGSDETVEERNCRSEELRRKIERDGAYIQNLRLGRSWVLPQFVDLAFNRFGGFSKEKYVEGVKNLGTEKVWNLMLRNYKVLCAHPDAERSLWWTKEVALKLVVNDYAGMERFIDSMLRSPLRKCSGGYYIHLRKGMFFVDEPDPKSKWNKSNSTTVEMLKARMRGLVSLVRSASSPKDLYDALVEYDRNRISFEPELFGSEWPEEFVNAYIGDGVYCSMMTMVKYLGLCFKDDSGKTLTRDECIDIILRKAARSTGMELLDFCAEKFFGGSRGVFDYFKYKRGGYVS